MRKPLGAMVDTSGLTKDENRIAIAYATETAEIARLTKSIAERKREIDHMWLDIEDAIAKREREQLSAEAHRELLEKIETERDLTIIKDRSPF